MDRITGLIFKTIIYLLLCLPSCGVIGEQVIPHRMEGKEEGYLTMLAAAFLFVLVSVEALDMTKKSIIFDKKTPGVFYCPQHKPTGIDKMIVRARPLSKLCEFDGNPLPDDYKSDCYKDVDESDFACKEKARIMIRLHPPGTEGVKDSEKWVKAYDKYIKKKKF